ncbi:MAG: endonuclease domain-containing protein, partial [Gammaproteobacteria bacterium]
MSDAEKRLWERLRKRQVGAYRFRRQHPLGRYIVDFVCLEARLVVEVDGGQPVERVGHEQKRSAWLGKHRFRVLRFWNHEVMNQTEAVMTVISEALHGSVQPPSSPCILIPCQLKNNLIRCGACGQRGARWETRSVFHGKRPGAPQAHCRAPTRALHQHGA